MTGAGNPALAGWPQTVRRAGAFSSGRRSGHSHSEGCGSASLVHRAPLPGGSAMTRSRSGGGWHQRQVEAGKSGQGFTGPAVEGNCHPPTGRLVPGAHACQMPSVRPSGFAQSAGAVAMPHLVLISLPRAKNPAATAAVGPFLVAHLAATQCPALGLWAECAFSMSPPSLLHPSCTRCDQAAGVLLWTTGRRAGAGCFERLPGSHWVW
jgi:hypothetical protein